METKDRIYNLRKGLQLSQDEFAARLFVTRQAVSRWETGETMPSTDTLRQIAGTFDVSVDALLGMPPRQCQSCGMMMDGDAVKGTNEDGSLSDAYCSYCFADGAFAHASTVAEMAEHNLRDLDAWNRATGLDLSKEEARAQLLAFLPTLARWRKDA